MKKNETKPKNFNSIMHDLKKFKHAIQQKNAISYSEELELITRIRAIDEDIKNYNVRYGNDDRYLKLEGYYSLLMSRLEGITSKRTQIEEDM